MKIDEVATKRLHNEMEFEAGELTDDLLNEVYDAIMKYYPEIRLAEDEEEEE